MQSTEFPRFNFANYLFSSCPIHTFAKETATFLDWPEKVSQNPDMNVMSFNRVHEDTLKFGETAQIYVIQKRPGFLIVHRNYLDAERFIRILNQALNAEATGTKKANIMQCKGFYGDDRNIAVAFERKDAYMVFNSLKHLLVSSARAMIPSSKTLPEELERIIEDRFAISVFHESSFESKVEESFGNKEYKAVCDMLVKCRTPQNADSLFQYAMRLVADSNFNEALHFLNADREQSNKVQRQIFNVLGVILEQDANKKSIDQTVRREYEKRRIEIASSLEEFYPDLQGVADRLFTEYTGCDTQGPNAAQFSLKDQRKLVFELAERLYQLQLTTLKTETQGTGEKEHFSQN